MNGQRQFDWDGFAATMGWFATGLAIAFAVCYIILPVYLIFRLGANARRDAKYQREVMHAIGMLRIDLQQRER